MHREVARLFQSRAPDLLEEFVKFLPPRQDNQDDRSLKRLAAAGGTGGDRDRRRKTGGADTQKRKRKAPEKESREREIAPKISPPSKASCSYATMSQLL